MVALVSLDHVKAALRIDHTDDDFILNEYIDAASGAVIKYLKEQAPFLVPFAADDSGVIGAVAQITDGSGNIELPAWTKLDVSSVVGAAATLDGTDIRLAVDGAGIAELRGTFTYQQNQYVAFGWSIDGGDIVELGRIFINTNSPILATFRQEVSLTNNALVSFYISATSDNQLLTWSGIEAFVITPDEGSVTSTLPQIEQATTMLVGIWYRDPDGDTDKLFQMGYLPAPVTAILYPLRDPAVI